MNLSDFKGNDKAKALLSSVLEKDKIGHAYIFAGPSGSGKKTLSRIFIKAALCESRKGHAPCGFCSNCKKMDMGSHPDVKFIGIDDKKSGISIDQVREIIRDIPFLPNDASRKFYVIEDCDTMRKEAQNALLKSLEEPPSFVSIILLTENSSDLLPTIRSRAASLTLAPIDEKDVAAYLTDRGIDIKKAERAARASGGMIGRAISIVDDDEGSIELADGFCNLLLCDKKEAFFSFGKKELSGGSDIPGFLEEFIKIMRDALIFFDSDMKILSLSPKSGGEIRKMFEGVSKKSILNVIDISADTKSKLDMRANLNVTIFDFMCRVWREIHG